MGRLSAWSRPSWASVSGCTSPTFFSQPARSINGNDAVRLPAALSRLERPGRGSRRHVGSYPLHSHAHAYAAGVWRLSRKTAAHVDAIGPCRAMAGAGAHPYRIYAAVHHGNLSTGHKVIQQMQMKIVDAGRRPRELYLCYLTCPQCANSRGGEKILFLRHWEESALLQRRLQGRG